ncbi:MAG: hypothetical protein H0W78_16510 [Planctomycetes bacterium]|nr:hypothetical protein [Planctomycetota bacterium]
MTKDELCQAIRRAFAGVELGDGIGLWEAQAIDDYDDATTRQEKRRSDERHDWSRITPEALNYAESSLSFFDAAGMRFHLPAFLIAELNGTTNTGPIFHLTQVRDPTRFSTLSGEQRCVVREFMQWCLEQPEYEYERSTIIAALNDHWTPV